MKKRDFFMVKSHYRKQDFALMIIVKNYHGDFLYPRCGKKRERMYPKPQKPYKVYRVGGRRFPIFLEYDEQLGESYPVYPDFEKNPEYTDEGRPFATAEQDSCSHCKPVAPGRPMPEDCGGCGWFYREDTPYDLIGICMCDALRRKTK